MRKLWVWACPTISAAGHQWSQALARSLTGMAAMQTERKSDLRSRSELKQSNWGRSGFGRSFSLIGTAVPSVLRRADCCGTGCCLPWSRQGLPACWHDDMTADSNRDIPGAGTGYHVQEFRWCPPVGPHERIQHTGEPDPSHGRHAGDGRGPYRCAGLGPCRSWVLASWPRPCTLSRICTTPVGREGDGRNEGLIAGAVSIRQSRMFLTAPGIPVS